MRIEELTAGSEITLYVTVNDSRILTFEANIVETIPKKHSILVDAILRDEKVLSFKGDGIIVNVMANIPNEKPILFKNVDVKSLKMDENTYCYSLTSDREGVTFNRRNNFRCFVGNTSPLYDRGEVTDREIVLRDVSTTGFAITCDANLNLAMEQPVHVHLEDYLEELDENFFFHLRGFVVRRQELEQGKIIYGCRLSGNVIGLESYIAKKERIRIRKSRGVM